MNFKKIYLNGHWKRPTSNQFIDIINPATEEMVFCVPSCNQCDVQEAIQSAYIAKDAWRKTDLAKRIDYLKKALDILKESSKDVARSITNEIGSPIIMAQTVHVDGPLMDFKDFITLAEVTNFTEIHKGYSLYHEPFGVISCMTPWNYPLYQVIQKVIPALLCGNTVVLKPSSEAPGAAYFLTEAFHKAGLPSGVFNMVTGKGSELGETLSTDPRIAMVSFTGSTAVGKKILHHGSKTIKKIALELGGKSPAILLESGDLKLSVKNVMDSCFYNTGQTCSAFTRFFIPSHKKLEVLELIKKNLSSYKVGHPEGEDTVIGPLVSKKQQKIVYDYVKLGMEEGATLALGELPNLEEKGCYFNPCVFTDVKNTMKIAKEEIFGPVLCVLTYDNLEEAIIQSNDSPYGLSGTVFGEHREAIKVAEQLETGNVHINDSPFVFNAPFGGYKESGIGRESGIHGLLEFTEKKAVFIGDINRD